MQLKLASFRVVQGGQQTRRARSSKIKEGDRRRILWKGSGSVVFAIAGMYTSSLLVIFDVIVTRG